MGSLVAACGIWFPDQGSNLGPLHWAWAILVTGTLGKSQKALLARTGSANGKELDCPCRKRHRCGLWFGKMPWRSSNPLQYSHLENSTERGAWWATVQGVTKSQTDWAHSQSVLMHDRITERAGKADSASASLVGTGQALSWWFRRGWLGYHTWTNSAQGHLQLFNCWYYLF